MHTTTLLREAGFFCAMELVMPFISELEIIPVTSTALRLGVQLIEPARRLYQIKQG